MPDNTNKPDDFQCTFHNRKWDWHRLYCLFGDRPRLRWQFAICLVIIVTGVMVIGIVATASYFATGYAIFSKVSGNKDKSEEMPLPAVDVTLNNSVNNDVDSQRAGPFVTSQNPASITMCDSDIHGCQSFGILDICCASPTSCYRTTFSPSGVYCCDNSTTNCEPGPVRPPVCATGLTQCDWAVGGGCCPNQTDCSIFGCLSYDVPTAMAQSGLSPEDTAVVTVTPNVTTYKLGEIVWSSSGSSRAISNPLFRPTSPQVALISAFVSVFVIIRRLLLC
ncbi:hypothetical protein PGQ11_008756 [Apiospora arundinis]|uniref:Uncharacterized protein n=1 Tax=Apiospora arundinis TaxID=335852 RepID=A0ABR2IGS1_9PEZI